MLSYYSKVKGYVLLWVMLILLLLSFLTAHLYSIYSQKLMFDRGFMALRKDKDALKALLKHCENTTQIFYEQKNKLETNTLNSVEAMQQENTAQYLAVIENVYLVSNSIAITDIQISQAEEDTVTHLFEIKDLALLQKYFSENLNDDHIDAVTQQCLFYQYTQYPLIDVMTEQQQLLLAAYIEQHLLLPQMMVQLYVYASHYDRVNNKHSLLRSNYVFIAWQAQQLFPELKLKTGRKSLIDLTEY